jgi:CrcB protein
MLKAIVLVGIGGGMGSVLRYMTSSFMTKYFPSSFPWGTLSVNVLGCLLMGVLLSLGERQSWMNNDLRLLWLTGFCGGYTTFSTFASENIQLWQSGQILTVIAYTIASVLLGLVAVWLGLVMVKM